MGNKAISKPREMAKAFIVHVAITDGQYIWDVWHIFVYVILCRVFPTAKKHETRIASTAVCAIFTNKWVKKTNKQLRLIGTEVKGKKQVMSVFLSYHFSMQPCSVVFSVPFLQYYSNLKHGLVNVCSASIETEKSFPFGKETEREMKEQGKNEETCFLADSCAIFPDSVRFFLTH